VFTFENHFGRSSASSCQVNNVRGSSLLLGQVELFVFVPSSRGDERSSKMLSPAFATCKYKVHKETDKEWEKGKGRQTPGKRNSPNRWQGQREACKCWRKMGEVESVKTSAKSSRNQGRGDRVEDDREMAGEPVRQTEAAHATDVLDQVVGAVAVGGKEREQAKEEGRPERNGRDYEVENSWSSI